MRLVGASWCDTARVQVWGWRLEAVAGGEGGTGAPLAWGLRGGDLEAGGTRKTRGNREEGLGSGGRLVLLAGSADKGGDGVAGTGI